MKAGRAFLAVLMTCFALEAPAAHALDRDKRAFISTSLVGAGVGTLAGLVVAPFARSGKTILQGTSVGLYLGMMVGIYHITHRDDPGNPLRGQVEYPLPQAVSSNEWTINPPLVEVSVPVYRF